jgi:cation:H+ antiporter
MPPAFAIPLFLVSLVVALWSAAFFARVLDRLGVRMGLPEVLLGVLTALAADGPEITSAIVALAKGATGVSLGVVVGSNVFNLAAMLGLSVLLAGRIRLARETLAIEGTAGLLAALLTGGVVLDFVPAAVGVVLLGCVLVPYGLLLARGPLIANRLGFLPKFERRLVRAGGEPVQRHDHEEIEEAAVWKLAALIVPAVALIVLGSTGMVETAVALADRWRVPAVVLGVLVLAPLTSLPNAFTAIRLGRAGRGAALVSETLNSNTINLVAGVAVPALFVSVVSTAAETTFDFAWLLVMTVASLLMLSRPRGMGRQAGVVLVGLFVAFVAVELAQA